MFVQSHVGFFQKGGFGSVPKRDGTILYNKRSESRNVSKFFKLEDRVPQLFFLKLLCTPNKLFKENAKCMREQRKKFSLPVVVVCRHYLYLYLFIFFMTIFA